MKVVKCQGNGSKCPNEATEFWMCYGPPYDDGQADEREWAHSKPCYHQIFPEQDTAEQTKES